MGAILPATSASPWAKRAARSISPGGTNEKTSARCARSAAEFMRMRTRLSHCESTFSCTFWGRWVTSDQVEAELAALAGDPDRVLGGEHVSGSPGSAGQTLCASSITIATGSRRARRRQRRSSTAPAVKRLLLARAQRAEVDHQAAGAGRIVELLTSGGAPRGPDHTPQRCTPRLRARRQLASLGAATRRDPRGCARSRPRISVTSSEYSSRSTSGSSRSVAAWWAGLQLPEAHADAARAARAAAHDSTPAAASA